ncbi:MAG TPA: type II secretion system F family protein [Candidatus Paceibacterota bacterium]
MPTFIYKIKKADGTIREDTRDAIDKYSLYRDIRKEGETVVSVTETAVKKSLWKRLADVSTIKQQEKIVFSRNMASMLEAGLPMSRALTISERQSRNRRFKLIIGELNNEVKAGKSFSEALKKYPRIFPDIFSAMIRAGEESGTLAASLKRLSDQMDQVYKLHKRIKGAMIYPSIILILMVIISIVLLVYVVPTLTSVFKDMDVTLPITTLFIIGASDFVKNHYLLLVVFFISFFGGLYFFNKKQGTKKFLQLILLHIPIVGGIIKESNAAQTARTLSSLLSSGVDYLRAIEITRDVIQNLHHKKVLEEAREKIQKGEPISSTFKKNEHLYPAFVGEMINVGEETGKLAEMLADVALFYENEVEQRTKDMSTVIEPFLMIIIGASVGFFAVAMIQPTYSLLNAI